MATAKVIWCNGEQIILFPETFRLDSDEVMVRLEGNAIILEPIEMNTASGSGPSPEDDPAQ
jgi:virulence-associated protein VagC